MIHGPSFTVLTELSENSFLKKKKKKENTVSVQKQHFRLYNLVIY